MRAAAIPGAPTKSTFALVSTPDRHLICFGTEATVGDDSTQDRMFVRFSNQEDIEVFTESATNTAGGQRLSNGNKIISALRSRGQILIFTDDALHGMQYLGPPYTFGFQQLGAACGIISPHAAIEAGGVTIWMGAESFFLFDGTVKNSRVLFRITCSRISTLCRAILCTQGRTRCTTKSLGGTAQRSLRGLIVV